MRTLYVVLSVKLGCILPDEVSGREIAFSALTKMGSNVINEVNKYYNTCSLILN